MSVYKFGWNTLPRLRDRVEDIIPLANHFLRKHESSNQTGLHLMENACSLLLSFSWPGNVRELENAIIRGIHYSRDNRIDTEDLGVADSEPPNPPDAHRPFKVVKRELIEAFERDYLTQLMSAHQGNVSKAAWTAKKERRDLGKMLKRYGIDPDGFRPAAR